MKQIKLMNLELINFKGIKHFVLNAAGENVSVFGDNATGKTTLFDAFIWLLFDKDSMNKKDFGIKTTTKEGNVIHKLNHEAEVVFLVDDKKLTLRKVYAEDWVTKNGTNSESFSGHKTKYYIDGVPSKKNEYTTMVKSIVNEDVFKLLTSPSYFNEQLHWKDRRDILMEVAGDVTDEEIITSNQSLNQLTKMLNGRDIEDHKKVVAEKKKAIKDDLKNIPPRIDEINRGLPDTNGLSKNDLDKQLEGLNQQLDVKQEQINDIRNGSEVSNKRRAISDIELNLVNIKNEHAQNGSQEVFGIKTKVQEEESNIAIFQSKLKSQDQRKQMNVDYVNDLTGSTSKLRDDWKEENNKEFTHESDCECPSCGQALPEDQVAAAKEKALAAFNRNKAEKLETINKKGVTAKGKIESINKENEVIDQDVQKIQGQIEVKQDAIKKFKEKLSALENSVTDITENKAYIAKLKEKESIEKEIDELKQSVDKSIKAVQEEVIDLKEKQSAIQIDLSKLAQSEQSIKRIAELETEEKELSAQHEQLEHESYLIEEFTKAKVNLLTEKINSKFKQARFNLFDEQVNGGLSETCVTTFEGIPYGAGLNNAACINVGLDIIDTLAKHYGVQAPIFVDNAESVTELTDIYSQIIGLVVSKPDKVLRIENAKELELV